SRNGTIIKGAVVIALLAVLLAQAAVGREEGVDRAVLREATFDPDTVSTVLDRIVGRWLVGGAAMPCRTRAFLGIAGKSERRGVVDLDIELRIVFDWLAGLRIEALRPVQVVDVLGALDEFSCRTIERIEEAVASKMTDDFPCLSTDDRVIQHVDTDLIVIPG